MVAVLLLASDSFAQKKGNPVNGQSPIRTRLVDLTRVEPLPGYPASTVSGFPHCSSDGSIFSEVYATSDRPDVAEFPDLYSISELREVKKIKLPLPNGYQHASLRSLFPAKSEIVALIQVSQPKAPDSEVKKGQKIFFLSLTDLDGSGQKNIRLDLRFEPSKAAIFDAGRLLVLGVDTINQQPVLALLHEDGSLDRMMDLDERTYEPSHALNHIYKGRPGESQTLAPQRLVSNALNNAQFVPWGAEILLAQPGSKLPVYRLRAGGQQEAVTVKLPEGSLLETILGSSERDTWVIRTKDASSFEKVTNGGVVENPPEKLFEVDPQTGEVIDQLLIKGPHPGELSCAAHGKLSALYYGLPERANVPDEITYASAPR